MPQPGSFYVYPSYAQSINGSNMSSVTPGAAAAGGSAAGLGGAGIALAVAGMVMGAIGSFYGAKTEANQLRSRALSAEFEASESRLNAAGAEMDAQSILAAGAHEKGLRSLGYAQEAGAQKVATAASGVEIGNGSAAEVAASIELAKQVDMLTVTKNTVQAAGQARMQRAQLRGRALIGDVSAANLRASARTINPALAAITSLVGGGGQLAGQAASYSARGY